MSIINFLNLQIDSEYFFQNANLCFRGKVLKCSGCQYVYYCNRECQTNAWKFHKLECVCLKRAAGKIVPDAARVIARIILKLNNGGDVEKGYYSDKFFRRFKDLMSRKPFFFQWSTFFLQEQIINNAELMQSIKMLNFCETKFLI